MSKRSVTSIAILNCLFVWASFWGGAVFAEGSVPRGLNVNVISTSIGGYTPVGVGGPLGGPLNQPPPDRGAPSPEVSKAIEAKSILQHIEVERANLATAEQSLRELQERSLQNGSTPMRLAPQIAANLKSPEFYLAAFEQIRIRRARLESISTGGPREVNADLLFNSGLYADGLSFLNLQKESSSTPNENREQALKYFDGRGVLKLPDGVDGIGDFTLKSNPSEDVGKSVRYGISSAYALKASVASNGSEADSVRAFADQLAFGYLIADSLGGSGVGQALQGTLAVTGGFVKGVANGAYDFAAGTVSLASALLFNSSEVWAGISSAITNYDQTGAKIQEFAVSKWDEFIHADAAQQSEMLGHLVFDVGSCFIPMGGIAKSGLSALEYATKVSVIAEKIGTGLSASAVGQVIRGTSAFTSIESNTFKLVNEIGLSKSAESLRAISKFGSAELSGARLIETESSGWIGRELLSNPQTARRFALEADEAARTVIRADEKLAQQALTRDALELRAAVKDGDFVYKIGEFPTKFDPNGLPLNGSRAVQESQYFGKFNPLLNEENYNKYLSEMGVYSNKVDYLIRGQFKEGTEFVTRYAPKNQLGTRPGGGLEIVSNPGSLKNVVFSTVDMNEIRKLWENARNIIPK